ncbi:uncharacterized protein LOC132178647 [Corylus avellana]|uniref:uncharacterized protein LOC132178647 n=1 Tax=Corylus avellana TaxID=13451 RepID=UPI001E1EF843|nr:uncharacterized protein LOC132178647 [Corylus avellana]
MAAPSNKSSSTPTISNRANFNSRNSELSNPMRRSFSGSPFTKPSIVANPRGFNPNTPANSPSDFSRRNSMGSHEDKENTKDQNPTPGKVRSPAASSRGGKNFMSPTISAVSKIAASPRKKILADRNEPARTSVSLSNEKPFRSVRFSDVVEHIDDDAKADAGLQENNKIEASDDDKEGNFTASFTSEALRCEEVLDPETDTDEPATVTDDPDCVNLDPTFKISPTSSCSWSCPTSTLAPLDADPSMPPYDPKTNFLSPRPQFLHYRPNPRVENYLNEESDGRRLEESFSDTEVTEETQSEDSQKENDDVSSGEMVEEEQEEEVLVLGEDVSEPTPISTQLPKETVEAKEKSKPQFFTRSKFIVLLLILSLAGLSVSVTKSPVIAPSVLKESSFFEIYDSSGIAESAKANLDGLARNFWLWYANSISFVSELMPNFSGVPISVPLHYCNLTALSVDIPLDGYLMFDQSHKENVHIEPLEEEGPPELEVDEDIGEAFEGFDYPEYEGQASQEEIEEISESEEVLLQAQEAEVISESEQVLLQAQEAEVISESEEVLLQAQEAEVISESEEVLLQAQEAEVISESGEVLHALEAEVIQADNLEVKTTQEEVVLADNVNSQEQPVMVSKGEEIQSEVSNEMISFDKMESVKVDEKNPESSELDDDSAENQQSSEVGESSINGTTDNKIFRETVLGIALLVLAFIAATGFIYMKKGKQSTTPSAAINVEQPLLTKKFDSSPMSVSIEHNFHERRPSWPTEVDMVGESCPSEMSSFERSISYSKKELKGGGSSEAQSFERSTSYSKKELKGSNEAQSQERRKPRNNYKRESLAPSSSEFSMGSPSYGSFTTYEMVPSKHGHGDEENTIITPVRRSSRIRKQVTSP